MPLAVNPTISRRIASENKADESHQKNRINDMFFGTNKVQLLKQCYF